MRLRDRPTRAWRRWWVAGVLAVGLGCGSSGAGGVDAAALNANEPLLSLSATDAAMLCDFMAEHMGGYGHKITCGDGSSSFTLSASKSACVTEWTHLDGSCASTIATVESCVNTLAGTPVCASVPATCTALASICLSAG